MPTGLTGRRGLTKTWRDSENGQSACAVCVWQTVLVWKYATVFLSAVWCTRSRRVRMQSAVNCLHKIFSRIWKTRQQRLYLVSKICRAFWLMGQADWPFSLSRLSHHVLVIDIFTVHQSHHVSGSFWPWMLFSVHTDEQLHLPDAIFRPRHLNV